MRLLLAVGSRIDWPLPHRSLPVEAISAAGLSPTGPSPYDLCILGRLELSYAGRFVKYHAV